MKLKALVTTIPMFMMVACSQPSSAVKDDEPNIEIFAAIDPAAAEEAAEASIYFSAPESATKLSWCEALEPDVCLGDSDLKGDLELVEDLTFAGFKTNKIPLRNNLMILAAAESADGKVLASQTIVLKTKGVIPDQPEADEQTPQEEGPADEDTPQEEVSGELVPPQPDGDDSTPPVPGD